MSGTWTVSAWFPLSRKILTYRHLLTETVPAWVTLSRNILAYGRFTLGIYFWIWVFCFIFHIFTCQKNFQLEIKRYLYSVHCYSNLNLCSILFSSVWITWVWFYFSLRILRWWRDRQTCWQTIIFRFGQPVMNPERWLNVDFVFNYLIGRNLKSLFCLSWTKVIEYLLIYFWIFSQVLIGFNFVCLNSWPPHLEKPYRHKTFISISKDFVSRKLLPGNICTFGTLTPPCSQPPPPCTCASLPWPKPRKLRPLFL